LQRNSNAAAESGDDLSFAASTTDQRVVTKSDCASVDCASRDTRDEIKLPRRFVTTKAEAEMRQGMRAIVTINARRLIMSDARKLSNALLAGAGVNSRPENEQNLCIGATHEL